MKYGNKIYIHTDVEEAKKLIGKKVIASSIMFDIVETPSKLPVQTFDKVATFEKRYCYETKETNERYQFIREVIDEPQYRPYTYEEAKAFVGQVVKLKPDCLPFKVFEQVKLITSVTKEVDDVQIMGVSAEIFLKKYEWLDGKPCGVEVEE